MKANMIRVCLAGFVFVAVAMFTADSTSAQCSTCPAPTVAYQPVVVQPVVTTQRRGWYPGKLLDSLRLRNYGVAAPTYNASYAPYNAAYPAAYTAGYAPYVSAYAPLGRTVVARPFLQTSYYPGVAASPCSSCVQTVARPVILNPVVTAGCSTCGVPQSGGCSACSMVPTGVSQASFTQPACSSCATSAAAPMPPSLVPTNPGGRIGPPTPQPQLSPNEPVPSQSNYPTPTPAGTSGQSENNFVDPQPLESPNTNTSFEAPRLLDPSDRTAQRPRSNGPTVDVWNAVYHKSSNDKGNETPIHQTSGKPTRTQAEIDADGWQSVPRS